MIRGVLGTFSYKGADFQLLSASAHDSSARTLVFNSIQRGVPLRIDAGCNKIYRFFPVYWNVVDGQVGTTKLLLGRIMFKLRQFNSSDLSFLGTEALTLLSL